MLALALLGGDEPKPSQPQTQSTPFVITIKIGGPTAAKAPTSAVAGGVVVCQFAKLSRPAVAAPEPCRTDKRCLAGYMESGLPTITAAQRENSKPRSKTAASARKTKTKAEPEETWPLTLSDAIRIALDNSEIVRVIASANQCPAGGSTPTEPEVAPEPIVICRLYADAAIWRFKSEVMAQVRSVEQMYWELAQARAALEAVDQAMGIAGRIVKDCEVVAMLKRVEGDFRAENEAEDARARLDTLALDRTAKTSDVIATERQLRNILGLPPVDGRRIEPITPPTTQRIAYDWETCLEEMMHEQPDIVQQRLLTRLAELQLLICRHPAFQQVNLNALYQLNGVCEQMDCIEDTLMSSLEKTLGLKESNPFAGSPRDLSRCDTGREVVKAMIAEQHRLAPISQRSSLPNSRQPLANTRQAQYGVLRSHAFLRQVVHQTTHSLARFFLEVDANYKQYATARSMRVAAEKRLAVQSANYSEGKITIDGYLDAIAKNAAAVATENQLLANYNVALAAVSEAKGTLLADRDIIVIETGRSSSRAYLAAAKNDEAVTKTRAANPDEAPAPLSPPPIPGMNMSAAAPVPGIEATINQGISVPKLTAPPVEHQPQSKQTQSLSWSISIKIGDAPAVELKGSFGADGAHDKAKTND
jgi:hypothetical protein